MKAFPKSNLKLGLDFRSQKKNKLEGLRMQLSFRLWGNVCVRGMVWA